MKRHHRIERKTYMSRYNTIRGILLKLKAIEYKGGKCVDCSYNDLYAAMEFHHRDHNEKEFEWHKLRKRSWSSIVQELDKCDLLCRNCHAKRHYNEQVYLDAINSGFKVFVRETKI